MREKVAVITGATKGLGLRIAEEFLAEGCVVVCAARSESAATQALVAEGHPLVFHQTDVRDAASVEAAMRVADERHGRLDILVSNAGISFPGRADALPPGEWSDVIETNVTGVFHCTQAATPYLEKAEQGRIINVSSALATRVAPGAAAYCTSKAAIEMFTRVCAIELAAKGITVNCLSPGIIDEGMGRALMSDQTLAAVYGPKLAMGRPGDAEEVARAAVFLASEASSYVNGHVLEVNGGLVW